MKILVLLIILNLPLIGFSKNIVDGFEALKIYNYFEAKRIFEKKQEKLPSPSSFGLAIIYLRKDNPFHQIDSAFANILRAEKYYAETKTKIKSKIEQFGFNSLQIIEYKRAVSSYYFSKIANSEKEEDFIEFIKIHTWAAEFEMAILKRDSLAFYKAMKLDKSSAFKEFLNKYPDSEYAPLAFNAVEEKEYIEMTPTKSINELINFINERPKNPYVGYAEDLIYKKQTELNTIDSYYQFIQNFPSNRNVDLAWRRLFQIFMYDYSKERIIAFKSSYPNYPFQAELEEELVLMEQLVYPYKENGLFGWMDGNGYKLSLPMYESLSLYKEGLALASNNNKVGFVDKNNKVVIPFQYDQASDFEDGRAIVELNEKMGIIDRSGKLIFDIVYEDIGTFSEGLVYAMKDSLYGYYNKAGEQVIKEQFNEAFNFENGLAKISYQEFENYINPIGGYLLPMKYSFVKIISEKLIKVQYDDLYGLVNIKGELVQSAKFSQISSVSEDLIAFAFNGKIGYFDENGRIVIPPTYDEKPNIANYANFTAGYARVSSKGKWGIIDKTGKWIITPYYSALGEISDLVAYLKDGLWGYINLANKVIVLPTYDEARSFEENCAIVSFNNRFGLIDLKGQFILPIMYGNIQKLDINIYIVKENNAEYLYNNEGNKIIDKPYESIRMINKDIILLSNENSIDYYSIREKKIISAK